MASGAPISRSVVIASVPSVASELCRQVLAEVEAHDFIQEDVFAVHLALEEAFLNAIKHGNKMEPDKHIKVDYTIDGNKVEISGKFQNCRAIGWFIDEYGQAKISINLTNYKKTSIHAVFDEVCRQAEERGLRVTGSEIVGLVPKAAMVEAGRGVRADRRRARAVAPREDTEERRCAGNGSASAPGATPSWSSSS